MMRLLTSRSTVALTVLTLAVVAHGQAKGDDTLYFSTTVGSFKLLPPGPEKTAGTLDVEFEGTLMVNGLKGQITPGAGVRLEYDRPKHERKVYFGKGHIRISGDFRSIQFFGRNLKGSFKGVAVARLYGEFDKNMETGYYWFGSNPQKQDWGSYGHTVVVPMYKAPTQQPGKVRDVPAKKGG